MLLATACALLVLALAAGGLYLRSYRPTRVPVVERARVPRDVRAKVNTDARLRHRAQRQDRGGRNHSPAPVICPAHAPVLIAVTIGIGPPRPTRASSPSGVLQGSAWGRIMAHASDRPLVQPLLVHEQAGAARPGSYFRPGQAPSEETITSEVRGPWAAEIVTGDGRITLPDDGEDVRLRWRRTEEAPEPGSYLS